MNLGSRVDELGVDDKKLLTSFHRKKSLLHSLRNLNDAEKLALKQLVELLKNLEKMIKEVEDTITSKIPKPVIELSKIPRDWFD